MWFIGVEVEQETSAPLLKKILDPPLISPSGVNKTDKTQASPEFNICPCIAPFLRMYFFKTFLRRGGSLHGFNLRRVRQHLTSKRLGIIAMKTERTRIQF